MLLVFLWILNIGLSALLIGFIILDISKRNGENVFPLMILFIPLGLVGWVMLGLCVPCRTSSEIVFPYITKTKTAVIIEYDDIRTIYTDAKTYNETVDSDGKLSYKLKTDYNMYGGKLNRYFEKNYSTTEVEKLQQ